MSIIKDYLKTQNSEALKVTDEDEDEKIDQKLKFVVDGQECICIKDEDKSKTFVSRNRFGLVP